MAGMAFLDRLICYMGMSVGLAGVLFTIYMFLVFNGLADSLHDSAISQADSAIAAMRDAEAIVSSTADSMDALTRFGKNASSALNASAGSLESMGGAVGSLASSLASVPYMPSEAIGPLQAAGGELEGTAQVMRDTASSMANASESALSTASGVQSLKEDIGDSIASMEDTKRQIDDIHRNAKIGLVLGSVLAALMFALNFLSFYRQLRDSGRGRNATV